MPNMDSERRSKSKNGGRSAPRSRPQILVKSGGCPAKYCQVESNVLSKLNVSYTEYNITRLEFRNPMHFAILYIFFKNFATLRENIKQYYYFRDLTIQ